jgi:deoxycytidylate deaminase
MKVLQAPTLIARSNAALKIDAVYEHFSHLSAKRRKSKCPELCVGACVVDEAATSTYLLECG